MARHSDAQWLAAMRRRSLLGGAGLAMVLAFDLAGFADRFVAAQSMSFRLESGAPIDETGTADRGLGNFSSDILVGRVLRSLPDEPPHLAAVDETHPVFALRNGQIALIDEKLGASSASIGNSIDGAHELHRIVPP